MFWSAAGFCRRCTRRGACPAGRRLTLPPLYPAGGVPALSPPYPAFSLLPCPLSPRPPSPSGKGETKVISCKGLRPLHPRAEPKRRWEQGRTTRPVGACPAGWRLTLPPLYPAGGVPALSPAAPAISAPAGGLAFFLACLPCLWFTFLPPSPLPPSRREGGDFKVILCKGLRPLHPRAEPKRRWEQGRTTHPEGACPAGWRLTLPPLYPVGWLAFFVASLPRL